MVENLHCWLYGDRSQLQVLQRYLNPSHGKAAQNDTDAASRHENGTPHRCQPEPSSMVKDPGRKWQAHDVEDDCPAQIHALSVVHLLREAEKDGKAV